MKFKITDRNGMAQADLRAIGRGRVALGVPFTDTEGSREALRAMLNTTPTGPKVHGPTLLQVYEKGLREHWHNAKDRRGVESRWMNRTKNGVADYFTQEKPVLEIDSSAISGFKGWLARGGAPEKGPGKQLFAPNDAKTVNRKLALLSKLLHLAADWWPKEVKALPKMGREKESEGRVRWLSDAEEATALALIPRIEKPHATDFAAYCEVLVDTGMRPSELTRLQDRDSDLTHTVLEGGEEEWGVARVWMAKGGKPRTVPLTERAHRALAQRLRRDPEAERRQKGTSAPFGNITQDIGGKLWADAREAMGLAADEEFVMYALRHTFAVRLLEEGVDISVVSTLLGHSKLETTRIYAHVSSPVSKAAIRALGARGKGRAGVATRVPNLEVVRKAGQGGSL